MKNYEYIEIPLLSVTKTPMVLLSTCEQGRKSFLQFNDFQKIILKGCDSVLYSLSLSLNYLVSKKAWTATLILFVMKTFVKM